MDAPPEVPLLRIRFLFNGRPLVITPSIPKIVLSKEVVERVLKRQDQVKSQRMKRAATAPLRVRQLNDENFNLVRAASTGAGPSSLPDIVDEESGSEAANWEDDLDEYSDSENGGDEIDAADWSNEGELLIFLEAMRIIC